MIPFFDSSYIEILISKSSYRKFLDFLKIQMYPFLIRPNKKNYLFTPSPFKIWMSFNICLLSQPVVIVAVL